MSYPTRLLVCLLGIAFLVQSCDKPSAPDFSLQSKIETPLVYKKHFEVLGSGSGAIIDTTSESFRSLFETDESTQLITLSKQQNIEIGQLDDVVPEVTIDPTSVGSEVGVIEVDDFTSTFDSQVGTFEQQSESIDPATAQVGTIEPDVDGSGSASRSDFGAPTGAGIPLPAGGGSHEISLSLAGFTSATIVEGGLRISFTNDLGIDLSKLTTQLKSQGSNIGSQLIFTSSSYDLSTGSTVTDTITFVTPANLQTPLTVDVSIEWDSQTTKNGNSLSVDVSDANLKASSATADIPSQALTPSTPDISVSNDDFTYAVLSSDNGGGTRNGLTIEVTNNTAIPLTSGDINGAGFPEMPTVELINSDGDIIGPETALEITTDPSASSINEGETAQVTFDLSGQKLTKNLSYTLNLGTSGASSETISSTDAIDISASTQPLNVAEARSTIDEQNNISLTDTNTVNGDFTRVEVNEGSLSLTFSNTLPIPLTIDNLTLENRDAFKAKNTDQFFAAGSEIGSISSLTIPANDTQSATIDLDGKGISDAIVISGSASSSGTSSGPVTVLASDVIEVEASGTITVNEASATLDQQSFNSSGSIDIPTDNFSFTQSNDYILLESGSLNIEELVNQLDVDIDTLRIEIDALEKPDGNPLTIRFQGDTDGNRAYQYRRIEANENGSRAPISIDLSDFRISSSNNQLTYAINGKTKSTSTVRTIQSSDSVEATFSLNDLNIDQAVGTISKKEFLLNDDESSNGTDLVDLFNPDEAAIDTLDELTEFSNRFDNVTLHNSTFNLFYTTNLGVGAEIYLAMVGIDDNGNQQYLAPKSSGPYALGPNENVSGLHANGQPVPKESILKLRLEEASQLGEENQGAIVFNKDNSTVNEFLSNLPTQIRFIGKAVANPDEERGFVSTPISFETELGFDIPINFSAATGSTAINDTAQVDLSDMPDPEEQDRKISEGSLTINYTSALPFGVDVQLDLLDENEQNVFSVPVEDGDKLSLKAASIDPNTHFVSDPVDGKMIISLNETQLDQLHNVQEILVRGGITTGQNGQQIKLRSSDYLEFSVRGSFKITTSVSGN